MQHFLSAQSVRTITNMVYAGLNFVVLGVLCYAGFHSGGKTSYILLVVSFCTHNGDSGECFPRAALPGCRLKPVP